MNTDTGWASRATAAIRAELAWQGRKGDQLADLLGADKRTITKRLSGEGRPFDLAEVEMIARWLDTTPSRLLARASDTRAVAS